MKNSRNKLYAFIFIACVAGYIWLFFNFVNNEKKIDTINGCLIKQFTNIPCPSCGTTRSIIYLSQGDFFQALKINPFGYLIILILFFIPFWIILDILTKKNTFYMFYKNTEVLIRKPKYAYPLILIVIINWLWNIMKGL